MSKSQASKFSRTYLIFYFLLSIAYSTVLIEPVLIPRQIVLSVLIIVIIYFYITDKSLKWRNLIENLNSRFLIILLLLFISICFSTVISFNKSLGMYVSSKYIIELIFLIFTADLLINKKITIENLCVSVLIFILVQLISVSLQSINIFNQNENIIDNKEIIGLIANKNLLASCLYLSLPFLIYISLSSFHKFLKITSLIVLILTLFFIYIIQSKTVYVALIIFILSTITLLFLSFRDKWTRVKKIYISVSLLLIIGISTSYFLIQKKSYLLQIFDQNTTSTLDKNFTKHNDNTTLLIRFTLWENSFQIIKESPILGKGPGNWVLFFPKYGLKKMKDLGVENGTVIFQNPHNDWILLVSELGILGFICYALFYLFGIYLSIKNIQNQKDKKTRIINILILSSWLGLFFIHFGDFPLERIEHQILIYTMYGIIIYSYSKNHPENKLIKHRNALLFSIVIVILTLISLIISYNRWQMEKKVKFIKDMSLANRWDLVLEHSKNLDNIFYTMDPATMPIDWYKGVAFFNLNQFNTALKYFINAYKINPYNVNVISNYAACLTKLNRLQKAEELYKKAILISPSYDELKLNLCVVYFKLKNYKSALNCLIMCSFDSLDSNIRYKTYVYEVTKAYLGNKTLQNSYIEKYFFSLKK